ncbi:hypothetical protein [Streptomyces sp. NPDC023327]
MQMGLRGRQKHLQRATGFTLVELCLVVEVGVDVARDASGRR